MTKKKSDSAGRRSKALRVFEGFAGYGGATFGLRLSGIKHEVVGYSEFFKGTHDLLGGEIWHRNF